VVPLVTKCAFYPAFTIFSFLLVHSITHKANCFRARGHFFGGHWWRWGWIFCRTPLSCHFFLLPLLLWELFFFLTSLFLLSFCLSLSLFCCLLIFLYLLSSSSLIISFPERCWGMCAVLFFAGTLHTGTFRSSRMCGSTFFISTTLG